jgi:hypothetical protein
VRPPAAVLLAAALAVPALRVLRVLVFVTFVVKDERASVDEGPNFDQEHCQE